MPSTRSEGLANIPPKVRKLAPLTEIKGGTSSSSSSNKRRTTCITEPAVTAALDHSQELQNKNAQFEQPRTAQMFGAPAAPMLLVAGASPVQTDSWDPTTGSHAHATSSGGSSSTADHLLSDRVVRNDDDHGRDAASVTGRNLFQREHDEFLTRFGIGSATERQTGCSSSTTTGNRTAAASTLTANPAVVHLGPPLAAVHHGNNHGTSGSSSTRTIASTGTTASTSTTGTTTTATTTTFHPVSRGSGYSAREHLQVDDDEQEMVVMERPPQHYHLPQRRRGSSRQGGPASVDFVDIPANAMNRVPQQSDNDNLLHLSATSLPFSAVDSTDRALFRVHEENMNMMQDARDEELREEEARGGVQGAERSAASLQQVATDPLFVMHKHDDPVVSRKETAACFPSGSTTTTQETHVLDSCSPLSEEDGLLGGSLSLRSCRTVATCSPVYNETDYATAIGGDLSQNMMLGSTLPPVDEVVGGPDSVEELQQVKMEKGGSCRGPRSNPGDVAHMNFDNLQQVEDEQHLSASTMAAVPLVDGPSSSSSYGNNGTSSSNSIGTATRRLRQQDDARLETENRPRHLQRLDHDYIAMSRSSQPQAQQHLTASRNSNSQSSSQRGDISMLASSPPSSVDSTSCLATSLATSSSSRLLPPPVMASASKETLVVPAQGGIAENRLESSKQSHGHVEDLAFPHHGFGVDGVIKVRQQGQEEAEDHDHDHGSIGMPLTSTSETEEDQHTGPAHSQHSLRGQAQVETSASVELPAEGQDDTQNINIDVITTSRMNIPSLTSTSTASSGGFHITNFNYGADTRTSTRQAAKKSTSRDLQNGNVAEVINTSLLPEHRQTTDIELKNYIDKTPSPTRTTTTGASGDEKFIRFDKMRLLLIDKLVRFRRDQALGHGFAAWERAATLKKTKTRQAIVHWEELTTSLLQQESKSTRERVEEVISLARELYSPLARSICNSRRTIMPEVGTSSSASSSSSSCTAVSAPGAAYVEEDMLEVQDVEEQDLPETPETRRKKTRDTHLLRLFDRKRQKELKTSLTRWIRRDAVRQAEQVYLRRAKAFILGADVRRRRARVLDTFRGWRAVSYSAQDSRAELVAAMLVFLGIEKMSRTRLREGWNSLVLPSNGGGGLYEEDGASTRGMNTPTSTFSQQLRRLEDKRFNRGKADPSSARETASQMSSYSRADSGWTGVSNQEFEDRFNSLTSELELNRAEMMLQQKLFQDERNDLQNELLREKRRNFHIQNSGATGGRSAQYLSSSCNGSEMMTSDPSSSRAADGATKNSSIMTTSNARRANMIARGGTLLSGKMNFGQREAVSIRRESCVFVKFQWGKGLYRKSNTAKGVAKIFLLLDLHQRSKGGKVAQHQHHDSRTRSTSSSTRASSGLARRSSTPGRAFARVRSMLSGGTTASSSKDTTFGGMKTTTTSSSTSNPPTTLCLSWAERTRLMTKTTKKVSLDRSCTLGISYTFRDAWCWSSLASSASSGSEVVPATPELSIVVVGRERDLELVAPNFHQFLNWFLGLQYLLLLRQKADEGLLSLEWNFQDPGDISNSIILSAAQRGSRLLLTRRQLVFRYIWRKLLRAYGGNKHNVKEAFFAAIDEAAVARL
ncbi:unnamed protein product [Amoebophrya sp. A25]|nr:unnamed protein product [Amoebophrya sp. A25]|eukprot:GSA25T00004704001.1